MKNNSILLGPRYLLEGFQLMLKPGLKRYVFIPLLINIVLFIGLYALSRHFFAEFNHWVENNLPHWLQWLGSILWLIFFLGFFLFMVYAFVTIANLVAAPFNSLLAEKVEFHLTGVTRKVSLVHTIKDVPRIIGRQLAILGYYIPRAIFLLILFIVPVVQIVAAILWFLFNAWFITLTYIDYPTDNNHIPLHNVREQMKEKRWLSLGFGMSTLVLMMIPIVNLFVIPAAVAGVTKLWVENMKLRK